MDSSKDVAVSSALHEYLIAHGSPPDPVALDLIGRTARLGDAAEMQIPAEQGALLTLLVKLLGCKNVVEVGTFTGYSTLCLARGLAGAGQVVTCDVSQEWSAIARDAWERAGVDHLVDLRLGQAADTLAALPRDPVVDLAFIDADKVNYVRYWEELVPRMRPGGLLVADNVFYYGEVVGESPSVNGAAIRAFNEHVSADSRVEPVMLPIADGITLARRVDDVRGGVA
ncbi:O-methyltransferase [Lentzea sp. NPDC058436]|uniref:O-methyltransferase n=1 Tax=Lentzea sp. NPDC058436 TaxID=3346499 RepID=UPI003655E854